MDIIQLRVLIKKSSSKKMKAEGLACRVTLDRVNQMSQWSIYPLASDIYNDPLLPFLSTREDSLSLPCSLTKLPPQQSTPHLSLS